MEENSNVLHFSDWNSFFHYRTETSPREEYPHNYKMFMEDNADNCIHKFNDCVDSKKYSEFI